MTGFEIYRYYLGIRTHFSSEKYDVVSAHGHVTAGQTAYAKRRDKALFEGLAKKYDQPREVIKYFVANFIYGHVNVLYDREIGQEMLQKWVKNKESLSRIFSNDLQAIEDYCQTKKIPITFAFSANDTVLKLYKSGQINIESVSLIHQFVPGLLESWKQIPETKLLYEADLLRIQKSSTFIKATNNCSKTWLRFIGDFAH